MSPAPAQPEPAVAPPAPPPGTEVVRVSIKCAADLHQALNADDLEVRLHVLAAVAAMPDKALSYGSHQGRDLIDLLVRQADAMGTSVLRQRVLETLAALPGQRSFSAMKKEFHLSRDPEEIAAAAVRLAREEAATLREVFLPFLMQDDLPPQARQAALALAGQEGLTARERMRVALLGGSGEEFRPPPPVEENAAVWLEALTGPHAPYARDLAQAQGPAGFSLLKAHWAELDEDTQAWLVDWGSREHPLAAVEVLRLALAQGPDQVSLAALEALPRLGPAAALFGELTAPFAGSEDIRFRLAVVRAGAEGIDFQALAADTQEDDTLRAAAIARLAETPPDDAPGFLAGLMADGSWRVRAAAARALAGLGEIGAAKAQELLEQENPLLRAAAAQVVQAAATGEKGK